MPRTRWRRMSGRWIASGFVCLAILVPVALSAQTQSRRTHPSTPSENHPGNRAGRIVGLRFWSLAGATRIAVEVDTDFTYRSDRLSNPSRVFFDISAVKPSRLPKRIERIPVEDGLVRQIRVAETQPGVTRVVLDLKSSAEVSASRLLNPERLIIEVRPPGSGPVAKRAPPQSARTFQPPPVKYLEDIPRIPRVLPARVTLPPLAPSPGTIRTLQEIEIARARPLAPPPPANSLMTSASRGSAKPDPEHSSFKEAAGARRSPEPKEPPVPLSAERNSGGDRSLTRVLGLKLNRVVLDPGHGGHDTGTLGPTGLAEKDLVLDVAKRLGDLIAARLGSEVFYTRTDDTFIPLEERTHIANQHKADLFLSIHANSSPTESASGVETYYLNFTTNRAALEVAARENASSERSIYELRDLIQKIALKDKLEESREFATRIQNSLALLSSRSNSKSKNRGVKKAPFVVLIGAAMPSVLAEIGFVSNPHDEGLMKKPEFRQKLAEALYKGVAQYASSLSHFQVAREQRKGDVE
jgi:N-acetylmuramoyl-L-alanine amidase